MNFSLSRKTFGLFGSLVMCAVSARMIFAQEVAPPPLPDRALMNQTDSEIPVPVEQSDIEAEVLTRGPVHEAFAEQYVADPKPTPIIELAPPELIDELPPEDLPEGTNVEWVPGYWAFDEDAKDFIWISGLWRDLPPGQQWVPGYWGEVEGGWQWVPGFWSSAESEELSYLPEPPESLEQGPNVEAPSPEYFWTPGTWIYQTNSYAWQPGCWARPYDDYLWVPSRYQWTPRGYVYCSGYWDYPLFRRGVLFSPVRFHNRLHRHRYYGYHYRPRVVVSAGPLLVHLFVRPRTRHYYFGDYYAHHYRSRGIYHLTRYNLHSHHRHAYDPIRSYYRVGSRRTTYNRLVDWHHYYDRHESSRPAHTYRQTRDYASHNGSVRNSVVVQQSTLGQPLSEMIAKTRTSKPKYGIQSFRHIREQDRDQLSNRSKVAVHDLKAQRIAFESRRGSEPGRDRNNFTESPIGKVGADRLKQIPGGKRQLGEKGELASMKLPENSVLRARLDGFRDRTESQRSGRNSSENARNSQRNAIDAKKGLENRTARTQDAGPRSQLESLRERIEATKKSRSDRESLTQRESRDGRNTLNEKNIPAKTTRDASNNDLRSRIEASRRSSGNSARSEKTSSDLKMRIEAARKAASSSATSRVERSGQLSSQPTTKNSKTPSIDRGTRSQNSSSDLNARIEAARRAPSSRQRTNSGNDPKTSRSATTSQRDMRARIEAAQKASAARRESRPDDRSVRSSSRSTTTVPKATDSRSRIPKTQSSQTKPAPSRTSRLGSSATRSNSSRQAIQDAAKRIRSSSTPSRTSSSRSSSSRSPSSSGRSSSTRSTPSRSSSSGSRSSSRSSSSSPSSRPSRTPRSSRSRDKK